MPANTSLDSARLRLIYWVSPLSSVALMTGLAWWLPRLMVIEPIAAAHMPLLAVALVAVPLVWFVARRLVPRAQRRDERYDPLASHAAASSETGVGRFLIALALCEIPVILGLALVLTGARPEHGLALGAASLILLLVLRPDMGAARQRS